MENPLRLLLIEDSESDALLAIRALEKAGFSLFWERADEWEAVSAALAQGKWDFILSHFQLQGFKGADVLQAYLKLGLETPFVIMSGTIGEETAVRLMKMGAADYLLKSNPAKLAVIVQKELAEAANRLARKQAENRIAAAREAIRKSEAKFRAIFDGAFQFIGLMSAEGRMQAANPAAMTMSGYPIENLIGKLFWELPWWPDENAQNIVRAHTEAAARGEFIRFEMDIHPATGAPRMIDFSLRLVEGGEPGVSIIIPEGRDITEMKKVQQDLREALNLLTEQNKRLINFSFIISHNLRSHTSSISAILDFLDHAQSPEESQDMLSHLRKVAQALDETIFNLNKVVSIQTNTHIEVEPLPLRTYAEKALAVLLPEIEANGAEIINLLPPALRVDHHPAYLESILINLLSNALRYAKPGLKPEIRLYCEQTIPSPILCIQDNGIGIDLKKNGQKLFGMYKTFTHHPASKGLGLFITKNQVEALGGRLEVESTLGKGSTFKVVFK